MSTVPACGRSKSRSVLCYLIVKFDDESGLGLT